MAKELMAQITLGTQSYTAMLAILKMARACVASNSTFGNLLKHENAVDTDVLLAIEMLLERDGKNIPLDLDCVGVSNVLVASDIVCKMFCCDAIDYVVKDLEIRILPEIARGNIISYATHLIKLLTNLDGFKDQTAALLLETNKKIFPC